MEPTAPYTPRRVNLFKPEWEQVNGNTYRMKTPAGWLVSNKEASAFETVIDPDHVWQFKEIPDQANAVS